MVHVKVRKPDGETVEVRRVSPVQNKRGAERYEHDLRELILRGEWTDPKQAHEREATVEPAPTLEQWAEIFAREHSEAKHLRPGTIREQRRTFARDLIPILGASTLIDTIGARDFLRVRCALTDRGLAPKTTNNVLGVLSRALRFYYEREGLDAPRFDACRAKVPKSPPKFYEPERYAALVRAAAELDPRTHAVVLLMGDCGLRTGEVLALEWSHVRWSPEPQIVVQRSYTAGHFGPPKSGRPRTVPMTRRTAAALRDLPRMLRAPWVITRVADDGPTFVTRSSISWLVCKAERRIGEETAYSDGQLHKLRHTYVTRLAAAGVPARTIMELAGHTMITTTLRYMHLLPGATTDAIAKLESFDGASVDGAEHHRSTAQPSEVNSAAQRYLTSEI